MEQPPLSLRLAKLSPPTCISTTPIPSPLTPVPLEPVSIPPPANFTISPSPHYAGPFGTMSLGETIKTHVILANTSQAPVRGVKMMIEVQGPNGRYKLGEIVEGEGEEADLQVDKEVGLDVASEMKDVGLNVLICSVAWETDGGRKTFQRFLKFNVTPPLAIKTRIHTPTSPSVVFDPTKRSDIHLEVLVQNTSLTGIAFDKVLLEPVKGLTARSTTSVNSTETLFPDDTKQYLFTLSPEQPHAGPVPLSTFPPAYIPGSILPLGRLDVAWFSAPYREAGRLQTSTLNRRVAPPVASLRPHLPSRTTNTLPSTPGPTLGPTTDEPEWEFDLVLDCKRQVCIEQEFGITLRLAARRRDSISAPRLALQYLSSPAPFGTPRPSLTLSPPSRSSTPVSGRPLALSSRPMTPVSSQLRQATTSTIQSAPMPPPQVRSEVTFPPAPLLTTTSPRGQITHLGTSFTTMPVKDLGKVVVDHGVTYDEAQVDERWEVVHEHTMRFMALDEGMCELGGLRVLLLNEERSGTVAREWESLGDVWVTA